MPVAFSRSMRSLAADSFRASLWGIFLIVAPLLAAAAWFFFARVELYESARNARVEVEREVHPVAALLPGRMVQTSLALGRKVQQFLLDVAKVRETTLSVQESIPLRIKRVSYRTPSGNSSRLHWWRVALFRKKSDTDPRRSRTG